MRGRINLNHSCEIGLIGLGVMERNLALNMVDHGFSVGVYNRTAEKIREFIEKEAGGRKIRSAYTA
jgi:6-phosphogluconate dehydrogenase